MKREQGEQRGRLLRLRSPRWNRSVSPEQWDGVEKELYKEETMESNNCQTWLRVIVFEWGELGVQHSKVTILTRVMDLLKTVNHYRYSTLAELKSMPD